MKSTLVSRIEPRHFLFVGKGLTTVLLLVVIFSWTLFLICVLPLVMYVANHGQSKKQNPINLSIAMLPAAFCGLLIWRIWYPRWNPNSNVIPERVKKWLPAPEMKRPVR